MGWLRRLQKDGYIHAYSMARMADKPVGRDPYDPARLSNRRLKAMLCPRAKCWKCDEPCGYGLEWLRRRARK